MAKASYTRNDTKLSARKARHANDRAAAVKSMRAAAKSGNKKEASRLKKVIASGDKKRNAELKSIRKGGKGITKARTSKSSSATTNS
ncbi:MAG: hypothetical protein ABL901_02940 [Hyphomicrobiaceae bacterium]|nr:hypothetical protein [Hyphomicrobiaceae bacterium]